MTEALYRKYRPQTFADVVGQEHIERTLKNAIDANKVSHAYLFCGPRGTGKTTMARLLAKALLCEKGVTSSPDGTCQDCREIADGVHPDVYELDAASRTGVENVRDEIIGRVNYAPTRGRYKVYIIDEVHMLSTAAFNALLKTLEEPPTHVVFILCTTDPQKVPETIHSRCQRFDFHRLSTDEIVSRLGAVCVAEHVSFEPEALELIAHRAEGGMRNALTSLEQLIAFGGGSVTMVGAQDLLGSLDSTDMAQIMHAIGTRDAAACFTWTAHYVESGADLAQFCRDMAQHTRDLYVLSLAGTDAALEITEAQRREFMLELKLFGPDRLSRMMEVLGEVVFELRTATDPRLCFEIALTRMIRPESDLTLASLAERIEALEQRTVPVPAQSVVPGVPPASGVQPVSVVPPAREAMQAPAAANPAPEVVPSLACAPAAATANPASASAEKPAPAISSDPAALLADEAALQRMWRTATGIIERKKVAYGALLIGVTVDVDESGGLAIIFPADSVFAFEMAQRPEMKTILKQALHEAAGMDIPFTIHHSKAQKATPSAPPIATPAPRKPPAQLAQPVQSQLAQPAQEQARAVKRARAVVQRVTSQTPPPAQAVPNPAALANNIADDDDDVPLDLYEGEATIDSGEVPPWQETAVFAQAARPTSPPTSDAMTADQLSVMASNAFGVPITFEEE